MAGHKLFFFIFFALLLFKSLAYCSSSEMVLIDEVDRSVANAYKAMIRAEKKGADVDDLVSDINEVISLYERAKSYYKVGNYNEANFTCLVCVDTCATIEDEANRLYSKALVDFSKESELNNLLNRIYIVMVFFILIFVWVKFRHRYIDKILDRKPVMYDVYS